MATDTIEKLRQSQDQATRDFADLAVAIANNRAVEEKKAADVLRNAGMTTDQLQAEVDRLHRIVELEAVVKQCSMEQRQLDDQRAELGEIVKRERKEFFVLRERLEKHAAESQGQVAAGQILHGRISAARVELSELQSQGDREHE